MGENRIIPDSEFIPSFSNHFAIHRIDGEVHLEFWYKEPPENKTTPSKEKLIKRITLTLAGAVYFCNALSKTVNYDRKQPPDSGAGKRF